MQPARQCWPCRAGAAGRRPARGPGPPGDPSGPSSVGVPDHREPYERFSLADIDEKAINTASMSGIRGVPTVCIWKKGEEVDRSVGSIPESKMRDFLNKNL